MLRQLRWIRKAISKIKSRWNRNNACVCRCHGLAKRNCYITCIVNTCSRCINVNVRVCDPPWDFAIHFQIMRSHSRCKEYQHKRVPHQLNCTVEIVRMCLALLRHKRFTVTWALNHVLGRDDHGVDSGRSLHFRIGAGVNILGPNRSQH